MAEYRANLSIKSGPITGEIALIDGSIVSEMTLRRGPVVRGIQIRQLPLRFAVEVENEIAVTQSMNPMCYAIADGSVMSSALILDAEAFLKMYSQMDNEICVESYVNACRGVAPVLNETAFSVVESPLVINNGIIGIPETSMVFVTTSSMQTSEYAYPSASPLILAMESEVTTVAEKYVSDMNASVGMFNAIENIYRGKPTEFNDVSIGVGISCEFIYSNFIKDIDALGNSGVRTLDSITLNELEYD